MSMSLKREILFGKFIIYNSLLNLFDYFAVKIVAVRFSYLNDVFFALLDKSIARYVNSSVNVGRVEVRSSEKLLLFIIYSVANDGQSFSDELLQIIVRYFALRFVKRLYPLLFDLLSNLPLETIRRRIFLSRIGEKSRVKQFGFFKELVDLVKILKARHV